MSSRQRDCFNEINITPLTDIFLVLLIIMMVIAPMLDQQGLNLAVPEVVNAEQIKQDSKVMNLTITEDNQFLWENQMIPSGDLEQFFAKDTIHYHCFLQSIVLLLF